MILVDVALGITVLVLAIFGLVKLAQKLKIPEAIREWFK
jgi:hypothetical protein